MTWPPTSKRKPCGVVSVDARPPGVVLLSRMSQEGLSWGVGGGYVSLRFAGDGVEWADCEVTHNLVQAFRGTETSRTGSNDEDVDGSV